MSQPPYYAPQPPTGPPPTPGSATTALVLGILSIVACTFFTGIPAMILGRSAKKQIEASNGALGGSGLATAGFWTGLIGTAIGLLAFLIVALVFAFGSSIENSFEETCVEIGQSEAQAC